MGLNKKQELSQGVKDSDDSNTKKAADQPVYALGINKIGNKSKEQHPIPFPWNCIKDFLYPESNHLCNIKNMALHDQVNTIRTYISSVFTGKNKSKK
jgi:hypothetical protein